jgi:hypothetical protein
METEEAGLIAEGIKKVKYFMESFRDVGGTQSTLNFIKVNSIHSEKQFKELKQIQWNPLKGITVYRFIRLMGSFFKKDI